MNGVSAVERSENSKIGDVSATYVSQGSCPKDCALLGSGCYAEGGNVGIQTRRLGRDGKGRTVTQLAKDEARAIGQLSGERPLRLHVVGDCRTDGAARTVRSAAGKYSARHGQPVWTYTHAWRRVARASWQGVSVLASCETLADVKLALARGYKCAMVAASHKSDKAWTEDGVKFIPCPQQTGRSESCSTCRLCWHEERLAGVIVFAAHGSGARRVGEKLVQIGGMTK